MRVIRGLFKLASLELALAMGPRVRQFRLEPRLAVWSEASEIQWGWEKSIVVCQIKVIARIVDECIIWCLGWVATCSLLSLN